MRFQRLRPSMRSRRLAALGLLVLALAALSAVGFGVAGSAFGYYYYYYNPPGPPASLVLTPPTAINPVGTTHTVTATVRDASNTLLQGIVVRFTVTGSVSASGQCTTSSSGQCTFTYNGPTSPGSDLISAFADTNNNGIQDTGEPTATATKTWVPGPPAHLTLTPPSAFNPVGTNHTVTATVTDSFDNAVPGVVVRFSVTGSVSASGQCTTTASGQCTFTYAGPPLPGSDVISAFADTNNNGVLDAGEPTATATKIWVFPTSTRGHVTGGGQITVGGQRITFSLEAKSDGRVKGNCDVLDHGTGRHIKCNDVQVLVVSGNEAWLYGSARDGGTTTTYVIHVVDNGEPGIGRDTFSILTASGYSKSGTLTAGNIQVHRN